jgi:predicted esterase
MPSTHIIATSTHGRYLVDRPAGDGRFPLLVGFHGYAESAERMLDALIQLRGDRRWLIASVQALNRFYHRATDDVVANWMTGQDREQVITDNVAYVAAVVSAVRREEPVTDVLVYAGFSQGVAMAYRAAAFAGNGGSGLIVLAGDVPPDVAPELGGLPPVLIGRGTTDHWYTAAKAAADLQTFAAAGVTPTVHVFDGGHGWDPAFVTRAGQFLDLLNS